MSSDHKKRIYKFSPDVEVLSAEHQDFLRGFSAGADFWAFSEFIQKEAISEMNDKNGVTYLVFDHSNDRKKLVAYYTLEATAMPYISRTKCDPEEVKRLKKEYEEVRCGIPCVEIKMFAVDEKYQDTWFKLDGKDKPISAWILDFIKSEINRMSEEVVGFSAILLHSVSTAEEFYSKNEFFFAEEYMEDFWSPNNGLKVMYLPLKDLKIVYEE